MDMVRMLVSLVVAIAVLAGYAWVFERIVEPMPDNWVTEGTVLLLGFGALVVPGVAFWLTFTTLPPKSRSHGL